MKKLFYTVTVLPDEGPNHVGVRGFYNIFIANIIMYICLFKLY